MKSGEDMVAILLVDGFDRQDLWSAFVQQHAQRFTYPDSPWEYLEDVMVLALVDRGEVEPDSGTAREAWQRMLDDARSIEPEYQDYRLIELAGDLLAVSPNHEVLEGGPL